MAANDLHKEVLGHNIWNKEMNLFVYGTLKRGYGLANHMDAINARFIDEAKLPDAILYNLGGWFPGVQVDVGRGYVVHGEVYEITEEGLAHLDIVEGYPNLFDRQQLPTSAGNAWVYLINKPGDAEIISHGVW